MKFEENNFVIVLKNQKGCVNCLRNKIVKRNFLYYLRNMEELIELFIEGEGERHPYCQSHPLPHPSSHPHPHLNDQKFIRYTKRLHVGSPIGVFEKKTNRILFLSFLSIQQDSM